MSVTIEEAADVARQHIPIMQRITREEYWCGFTIVRETYFDGKFSRFAVYDSSAWDKPAETPLLPWSAPKGERVATVAMDGSLRLITGQ